MLFYVVRNPIADPPVGDYHFVEALLLKPDGRYLCRTNLGIVRLNAEELEQQLEAMVYVDAGLSKEEVRTIEQTLAVLAAEKAEKSNVVEVKSVQKRLVVQKGGRKAG